MIELEDIKSQNHQFKYPITDKNEVKVDIKLPYRGEESYFEVSFIVDTGATASTLTLEALAFFPLF